MHAVEPSYTFNSSGWGSTNDPSSDAEKKIIHQYWVNFIKTGNPNGDLLPYWPPYQKDTESTMYFRDGAHVTALPNIELLNLWTEYFDWRRSNLTPVD